jgi:hypothetical protein
MNKCDKQQHKYWRNVTDTGWPLRFLFWPETGSESSSRFLFWPETGLLGFVKLSTGRPWASVPYIFFYVCSTYRIHFRLLKLAHRPPLWSSGKRSWLQIKRFGFDSRRYHIFCEAAVLERSTLSLVSTVEELTE